MLPMIRSCLKTVSYTHLDVYKRQALESAIPTKDSALSNNNADTTGDKTQGAESVEDSTEDSTEETREPKEDTAKADGSGFTYILMGIAEMCIRDRSDTV